MAQWLVPLDHYYHKLPVMVSNPIKGYRCFIQQEILPSLLSTSWFQEPFEGAFTINLK